MVQGSIPAPSFLISGKPAIPKKFMSAHSEEQWMKKITLEALLLEAQISKLVVGRKSVV